MIHLIILFQFLCVTVGVVIFFNLAQHIRLDSANKYLMISEACFCLFFILDTLKIYFRNVWHEINFSFFTGILDIVLQSAAFILLVIYMFKVKSKKLYFSLRMKILMAIIVTLIIVTIIGMLIPAFQSFPWLCFIFLFINIAIWIHLHDAYKIKTNKIEFDKSIFTQREQEIIQHICDGKSNRDISEILCISQNTVRNHIYNIYRKADVKNKVELINKMR